MPRLAGEKGRVLIIDDDRLLRDSLVLLLDEEFEVASAATVRDGCARVDERSEVVVVDFELPDGTGEQVLQHLGTLGRAVFTILMTARVDDGRVRALSSSNNVLVLFKPVEPEDLVGWIRHGLAMVRMSSASGRRRRP